MKKILASMLACVAAFSLSFTASAIGEPTPTGTKIANIHLASFPGVGINGTFDYVLANWGPGHFAVGGSLTTCLASEHLLAFGIAPRAIYGFNIIDNLEIHAGIMTGVAIYASTRSTYSLTSFCIGSILGAHYYFSDSFGVSSEINYTGKLPVLNIGVSFRF